MMTKYLAAGSVIAALMAGTAMAQTTMSPTAPAAKTDSMASDSKSVAKQAYSGQWRASKLIGVNVYNDSNEKLGDISELILDKTGKVEGVVIGVGGFLGLGQHDILVSMDKLKFVNEPVRTASSNTSPGTTTGASTTTSTTTAMSSGPNWYPDHAVFSATKDQVKAMPEFKYSDYK